MIDVHGRSSPLLIASSDVRTYEDLGLTANDCVCFPTPTISSWR